MQEDWNSDQPIYKQLRNKVAGLIMSGSFEEGEPLPSVRQVASQSKINHITVSKAYQELVDDHILESRRGLGMFVLSGARDKLIAQEREKFIQNELPVLLARLSHLEISVDDLMILINKKGE